MTDSALTNHGVLQAKRLGAHLKTVGLNTAFIYSSDLQRAFKTADAIRKAQSPDHAPVIQLPVLREQDFGFYEGKRFYERPKDSSKSGKDAHLAAHRNDPGFVDVESKEAMTARATSFVNEYLLGHIEQLAEDQTIVIVAHGIILNHLWRAVLRCFLFSKVSMAPGVGGSDRGLEYLGGWSNTGYLDLEIKEAITSAPASIPGAVTKDEVADLDTLITQSPTSRSNTTPEVTQLPSPVKAQLTSPKQVTSPSKAKLPSKILLIKAINSLEHLKGLKKARGGTGSLKHDANQKTVDSFFKKRKIE